MPKVISLEPHCSICGGDQCFQCAHIYYIKEGECAHTYCCARVSASDWRRRNYSVGQRSFGAQGESLYCCDYVVAARTRRFLYFAPFYLMCGGDGGGCVFCVRLQRETQWHTHTGELPNMEWIEWLFLWIYLFISLFICARWNARARTGVPFNLHDWNKCWCF
jgi:hypothetical protein